MADDKLKQLETAIAVIEKSYGKGSIMRLGSRDVLVPVSVIPTGCLSLDAALGVGGFPRGRVVEVYGPESGGKTTMTLHVIAEAQKLRKLTAIVSKSRTCLIFITQIREKIGVMFGNPETTTGGRALKFYASIRLDIRRIQAIKEGDRVIGSRTRGKVVKNKVAAPFREAEFDILYGEGISREGDLIDLGVGKGLLEKSGTWISYGGERMGQGRENAPVFLKENKDIRDKLETALRKKLEIALPGSSSAAPSAASSGVNGHAATHSQSDKVPQKAAAAAASAADAKRPSR